MYDLFEQLDTKLRQTMGKIDKFVEIASDTDRIKIDTVMRTTYHRGFARPGNITEIIIHGTGGPGNLRGAIHWFRSGERGKEYRQGNALVHYLIELDGTIWEMIDPTRYVRHSCRGNLDRQSIGIEITNPDPQNGNGYEFTDAEYDSLNWLVFEYLIPRFPTITTIMSHKRAWQKFTNGMQWKECPGKRFKWGVVESYMKKRGYAYDHLNGFESYWNIRRAG